MTNREAHEEAAGMPLEDSYFTINGIDPAADFTIYSRDDVVVFPPMTPVEGLRE